MEIDISLVNELIIVKNMFGVWEITVPIFSYLVEMKTFIQGMENDRNKRCFVPSCNLIEIATRNIDVPS